MRLIDILIVIIVIVLIPITIIFTNTNTTMLTRRSTLPPTYQYDLYHIHHHHHHHHRHHNHAHTQVTPPAYLPAFLKPKKGMKATHQVPLIIMVCVIIVAMVLIL